MGPGDITHPALFRLLSGQRRNATTKPTGGCWRHRDAKNDRGPHQRRAAKGGSGSKPEGKRLATEKRHRVDTGQEAKGLPLHVGGKERVSAIAEIDR